MRHSSSLVYCVFFLIAFINTGNIAMQSFRSLLSATLPVQESSQINRGNLQDRINYKVTSDYDQINLIVNNATIEDHKTVTIDKNDVNLKSLWLDTVLNILNNKKGHKGVYSDNLDLTFDSIHIDTKVSYASPVKPVALNRNKTEFRQTTDGKAHSSRVNNRSEGHVLYYDLQDSEHREKFNIDHLYQVVGYCKGQKYYLFSQVGKLTVCEKEIFSNEFSHLKQNVNLSQLSKLVKLDLINCTALANQLDIKDVCVKLDAILNISNSGLVTLTYGNYRYNIGLIASNKVLSHQWIDCTSCKIAEYFNDIGVPHSSNGTVYRSKDKCTDLKVSTVNNIYATISRHFGNNWELEQENGQLLVVTGNHKVTQLARIIDNGYKSIPVVYPIYDGSLPQGDIANILGQFRPILGRYIALYTDTELNNGNAVFNKQLSRSYRRSYIMIALHNRGVMFNPSDDISILRQSLPDDLHLSDKRLESLLTRAINKLGLESVKNITIDAKKDCNNSLWESENIIKFMSIM